MSGPRLALAVPGAPAAEVLAAARAAEAANLDALVIGDPTGTSANSDDTYVLTTAGAVAATTTDLRLCLALDLRGSAPPLRVAEDLGVVDVMSGGRVELMLSPGGDPAWRTDLDAVLEAWIGWPMPDGTTTPVTPAPVQPSLPAWLMDRHTGGRTDGDTATHLRGGPGALFVDRTAIVSDASPVPGLDALLRVRELRDRAGAGTVVVRAAGVPARDLPALIRTLGTVVGPCLRCPANEVPILAADATDWLLHRTELHQPPPR